MGVLLTVAGVLSYLLLFSSPVHYVSLFPKQQLQSGEIADVRAFLQESQISYREKGDAGFLVPEALASRLRIELASLGIPKEEGGKGFELFDSNTWIKGEKELQVLEMRALKGQLEKDIAAYENIKSASVILDLAPPRSFGGAQYQTKASVILTLMPGARLSTSQMRAITYHLAGAVRGLQPNMIAISDTSGKLYQAIGEEETGLSTQLAMEEHLQAKVDALLSRLVGSGHFHSTVHMNFDSKSEELKGIALAILIDNTLLLEEGREKLRMEIERQVGALLRGYEVEVLPVLDFVSFEKKKTSWIEQKRSLPIGGMIFTACTLLLAFACLIPLGRRFRRKRQGKGGEEDSLYNVMTQIDVGRLADSIQGEDPQTIALMLSYLEPHRGQEILEGLPGAVQDEVIAALAELEKEDVS